MNMKLSIIATLLTTLVPSVRGFIVFRHETHVALAASPRPVEALEDAAVLGSKVNLIQRAKEVVGPDIALGMKDGGECLAESFEFVAAVVGPISKQEFIGALNDFKLAESFDIKENFFNFMTDPMQPNRVWFMSRQTAIFKNDFVGVKATGKELILPPQIYHVDFNNENKVTEFGFYTADRRVGNTGGLGGAFAYFYGVGKNLGFREAMPYKPSFRFRMLQKLGALAKKMQNKKD